MFTMIDRTEAVFVKNERDNAISAISVILFSSFAIIYIMKSNL